MKRGVVTPEYRSWLSMKTRCRNPKAPNFHLYGGRGIAVCKRWLSFESFLADMGYRPPGTSLDRVDNALGYFRENCRWSTAKEQASNRRNNRLITIGYETLTLTEWARRAGISDTAMLYRVRPMTRPVATLDVWRVVQNGATW